MVLLPLPAANAHEVNKHVRNNAPEVLLTLSALLRFPSLLEHLGRLVLLNWNGWVLIFYTFDYLQ